RRRREDHERRRMASRHSLRADTRGHARLLAQADQRGVTRGAAPVVLGAALLLFLVLAVGTLRTLRPWVDEAWYGTPAWTLVEKGYMGTPSLDVAPLGMLRIERYAYWIMPGYPLVLAAWLRVAPFTLSALRVPSIVFVLAGIVGFSLFIGRLLRDPAPAIVCFVLLSCD